VLETTIIPPLINIDKATIFQQLNLYYGTCLSYGLRLFVNGNNNDFRSGSQVLFKIA
jgi:hypothetical protein